MSSLLVDPLEWALSLPKSDKFTGGLPVQSSSLPVVPEHEGWTLHVSRDGNLFKVAGRRGSHVVIRPRMSFEDVESFNPNKGWK